MSTYTAHYLMYLHQLYGVLTVLFLVAAALVVCWHIAPRILGLRWELYAPVYLAWCGMVYISLVLFVFVR